RFSYEGTFTRRGVVVGNWLPPHLHKVLTIQRLEGALGAFVEVKDALRVCAIAPVDLVAITARLEGIGNGDQRVVRLIVPLTVARCAQITIIGEHSDRIGNDTTGHTDPHLTNSAIHTFPEGQFTGTLTD